MISGVVIGCGAIAREHLAAVSEFKNGRIAAVCDLSAARAEATAERFGIERWYTDHVEMLSDVRPDLVHITTPPSSHYPLAKYCLTNSLNVLCEKPITIEYSQFTDLKQLARENGVMLIENQNFRHHSAVLKILRLIESGQLGDVVEVQVCVSINLKPYADPNAPHFGQTLRGGVVGDFLPHISYLVHMFTGRISDLRTIWTKTDTALPFPADDFRALLKGERASGYVSFSGRTQPNGFWLRVIGTHIHAEANLYESPRLTLRHARDGVPPLMTLIDSIGEARDIFKTTLAGFSRKLGGVTSYDGLSATIAEIYQAIAQNSPQPVSLEEIDETSKLVDRMTSPDWII